VSALAIPREYEGGIVVIKSLSDSDIEKVLEVLIGAGPQTKHVEVSKNLRKVLSSLPKENIEKLLAALHSLYSLRSYSDVPIDVFLDDLADAISESDNEEIHTSDPKELALLKRRFESLLTVRSLSLQAKASGLGTDFPNLFCDAKIITDIRPIWDGDVKNPPEATVITNTLKLEYHDVGGHVEIYMYLSKYDIETLMSVLRRAQEKTATLESLTTSGWMKTLNE
jgi:hypothetical protein